MPGPQPKTIQLTPRQEGLLTRLCRRQTSPQHQVRRAQIILKAAKGLSNKHIAQELGLARITVRDWRRRWAEAAAELAEVERQAEDKELAVATKTVLSDAYRSGTPPTFSAEQVVHIIALACEAPVDSERPISHWTAKEIAAEAAKRGIVERISPQSVERFLKAGQAKAASVPLLADERQSQRS